MSEKTEMFENDGAYANLVTGLGNASMDKDESTVIKQDYFRPNYESLAAQYAKDGIVKRLARDPVIRSLKNPIVIPDDNEDKTFKALSKIGFFKAVSKAGTWTRLYGGALLAEVYEHDGDADLSKPAPATDKIVEYRVFSPSRVILAENARNGDKNSQYYGKIEVFPVQQRNGTILHLHESRCHVFRGLEVPDELDSDINAYVFGISEVEMANLGLKKLPGGFGSLSNMLQENGLSVFSLNGLSSMLASKDNGIAKVRERMSLMKLGMSTMRSVIQDKDDAFEMKSHSMSDVPESVKMLMAYVSALTGIPVSILFGNMVSGLSSTNEGDIRQYEDLCESWRSDVLYEPMCRMLTSFRNRNEGKPGNWDFTFGEISQPSATEKADLFEKRVNSCKTLYDMSSITPKEIRQNLLVNGGTSEIMVESEEVKTSPDQN